MNAAAGYSYVLCIVKSLAYTPFLADTTHACMHADDAKYPCMHAGMAASHHTEKAIVINSVTICVYIYVWYDPCHTRMVQYIPYAYGTIIHTIRVWLSHMQIRVWYVPYVRIWYKIRIWYRTYRLIKVSAMF